MATVKIVQENGDIASMLWHLMKANNTNLTKVCKKHGLSYSSIAQKMNRPNIAFDLDELEQFIKQIDPKAKLSVDFNISLSTKGSTIFTQKTEK